MLQTKAIWLLLHTNLMHFIVIWFLISQTLKGSYKQNGHDTHICCHHTQFHLHVMTNLFYHETKNIKHIPLPHVLVLLFFFNILDTRHLLNSKNYQSPFTPHAIFITPMGGEQCYPHFTKEETNCPRQAQHSFHGFPPRLQLRKNICQGHLRKSRFLEKSCAGSEH